LQTPQASCGVETSQTAYFQNPGILERVTGGVTGTCHGNLEDQNIPDPVIWNVFLQLMDIMVLFYPATFTLLCPSWHLEATI
jgi:hypothetical protein